LSRATAIGTIITAVAVFEIHIETAAVAISMPSRSCLGSVPTACSTRSATRRCRPVCSIAAPIAMPPRNKKMYASKYGWAVLQTSPAGPRPNRPSIGNNNSGKHAVQWIGSASVSHNTAIAAATAAACAGRWPKPSTWCSPLGSSSTAANAATAAAIDSTRPRDQRPGSSLVPGPRAGSNGSRSIALFYTLSGAAARGFAFQIPRSVVRSCCA
jgi:hypothetical protein